MDSPVCASVRSSEDDRSSHIFTDLRSHDDLLLPVQGSKRLKYTCITCCRQYIALGSSHGGLYIFQRDTLKYLMQIGNKEGLTKALFSPNEKVIGLATSGGAVIAWQLNISSRQKAERLVATQTHRNHTITSLCWDGAGLRLFSGDDRGRITVTNTDSSKPSGLFKFQSELVVDVDSSVVQMDFAEERLLISTLTRCYLCDPKKRLSFQIGSKLRDGAYGACFLSKIGSEKPSIFCARPGSRLWEANTLCQVLNTHQFKQLLATPPLPVMGKGREVKFSSDDDKHPPQSLAFPILRPLGNQFLVTWNERGVFVFDPVKVNVLFWTNDISGLLDMSVSKSSLYCLHNDGRIRKYTLQTIARCAASLYQQSLLVQCSRLVLRFQTQFQHSRARHHMPPRVLHELAMRVAAEESILGSEVEELAVSVEKRMVDVSSRMSSRRSSFDSYDGMKLQSGIYVVRKRLDSECSDELPLGYDAHMERLQASLEWTSQDTIQETSLTMVGQPSKDATQNDTINSGIRDNGRAHTVVKDKSLEEETSSGDAVTGDIALGEQSGSLQDAVDTQVIRENGLRLAQVDVAGDGCVAEEENSNVVDCCEVIEHQEKRDVESAVKEAEDISSNKVDTPERITDATDPGMETLSPLSSHLDSCEPSLDIRQHSSEEHDTWTHSNESNICSDEIEAPREKGLWKQDAEKVGSATDGQIQVQGNSMDMDSSSTANQTILTEREEPEEVSIGVQGEEESGQVMMDDLTESDRLHQGQMLQEKGKALDMTKDEEVLVGDCSQEEHGKTSGPGADSEEAVKEMEARTPDAIAVGGISFEQLALRSSGVDKPVGITESNQMESLSSISEDNHNPKLEGPEVQKDSKTALDDIHLLELRDKGVCIEETAKKAEDIGNQRYTTGAEAGETKESFSVDTTVLLDVCLLSKETEVNDETEESQFQEVACMNHTTGEELYHSRLDENVSKVNQESISVDVSGFGLDVSGFGLSPSDDCFPSSTCEVEETVPQNQSCHVLVPSIGNENAPHQREDIACLGEESDQSVSLNDDLVRDNLALVDVTEVKAVDQSEESCRSPLESRHSPNHLSTDDSILSTSHTSKDSSVGSSFSLSSATDSTMSPLSIQIPNASRKSSSAENLEIVIEDDLEMEEGDAQFPDAETELIQSVTRSQYTQQERKGKINQLADESSGRQTPSESPKRKKTKSRVIDITATVSRKPSPLHSPAPGSVLYRPTSLPDLSPHSSSQPRSLKSTPSPTIPSPAMSPKKEAQRPSPVSSTLPSSNVIIAATSGLPHSSGLMETQQIILNSTAQINLKSVKDSLASKLTKTKTFLQSIGDSNPLSPKEEERSTPPLQPRPSPSPSPVSASPTRRKGSSSAIQHKEIAYQQSTERSQPPPGTSPSVGARSSDNGWFSQESEEIEIDSRLDDVIEATKTALKQISEDPKTRYAPSTMRGVLQTWVDKLEETSDCEGINPSHLPVTIREDVSRLAMLSFTLDIYANEEGRGDEREAEEAPQSEMEKELDECRSVFIKKHFRLLDRRRIMEVLQYKQSCYHEAFKTLLQCERAATTNSYPDDQDSIDLQETIDQLLSADLISRNLPQYLGLLQRLCGLDSQKALDMMISDFPSISPWHVYQILHDQPKDLILHYVEAFPRTHPHSNRTKFIDQVMALKPLVLSLAEAAVTFDTPSPSDLFCDCGILPKLGSHLITWSHDLTLDLILTSGSAPVDDLLPLFLRAGYWRGAVVLLRREKDRKMDALKICIQLGDVALIEKDLIPASAEEWKTVLGWMKKCQPSCKGKKRLSQRNCLNCGAILSPYAIKSVSKSTSHVDGETGVKEAEVTDDSTKPECDWSITEASQPKTQSEGLTEKCKQRLEECEISTIQRDSNSEGLYGQSEEGIENCSTLQENVQEDLGSTHSQAKASVPDWSPTVTWQRIAFLLVGHLGALEGVKLLREVQVPDGFLTREFNQMCIYACIWERKQSLLSHAMIEGTDTYLWSKRHPLLGPFLQHIVMEEHQDSMEGCKDIGSQEERVLQVKKLLGQGNHFIEDPRTHWGQFTNLSRICSLCQQPLSQNLFREAAGCLIFPCGHAFHIPCIPEKACTFCYYGNQEKHT
ncbi:uncharacterized protein LOC129268309 isoform X1 [Lytechinus pictus]|uniref:uncharacterized protein LOC129268309 isoform X1 n=2 Tax=Lytechinus pictus TaxID=7653 RepID=UPI0030BA0958